MSWVRWQDETWPVTQDRAAIEVWLTPPDAAGPREFWDLRLLHETEVPLPGGEGKILRRTLEVVIEDLGLRGARWEDFSGRTIRSTAAFQDEVDALDPHANQKTPLISVGEVEMVLRAERAGIESYNSKDWRGTDFILTLGRREGLEMSCELEAWLMPEKEFWRQEPETTEELARFGEGPPDLHVMTPVRFTGGSIDLERCGDDPAPLAAQRIRGQIGMVSFRTLKAEWIPQQRPEPESLVRLPGWRSTVAFRTRD